MIRTMRIIEQNTVDCTLNDGLLMASPCLFKSKPHVSWWNPNFVCVCVWYQVEAYFCSSHQLTPPFYRRFLWHLQNLKNMLKPDLVNQMVVSSIDLSSIWPKMPCNVLVQQCRGYQPYIKWCLESRPFIYQIGDGGSILYNQTNFGGLHPN